MEDEEAASWVQCERADCRKWRHLSIDEVFKYNSVEHDLPWYVPSSLLQHSQGSESGNLTCAVQGGVNVVGYVSWRVVMCIASGVYLGQPEWLVGTPRNVRV